MTTFNEREDAFEKRYALDEELRFHVDAEVERQIRELG